MRLINARGQTGREDELRNDDAQKRHQPPSSPWHVSLSVHRISIQVLEATHGNGPKSHSAPEAPYGKAVVVFPGCLFSLGIDLNFPSSSHWFIFSPLVLLLTKKIQWLSDLGFV
jgi:hypothetical protein